MRAFEKALCTKGQHKRLDGFRSDSHRFQFRCSIVVSKWSVFPPGTRKSQVQFPAAEALAYRHRAASVDGYYDLLRDRHAMLSGCMWKYWLYAR